MKQATLTHAHRLLGPRSVFVILAPDRSGNWNAAPISNVTSISVDPQIIAIASYRKNRTSKLLRRSRPFVCCLMDARQIDAVWRSAGIYSGYDSITGEGRFKAGGLKLQWPENSKTPVIEGSLAALSGKIIKKLRPGDHMVFFGKVLSAYFDASAFREDLDFDVGKASPLLQVTGNKFCEVTRPVEVEYGPGKSR